MAQLGHMRLWSVPAGRRASVPTPQQVISEHLEARLRDTLGHAIVHVAKRVIAVDANHLVAARRAANAVVGAAGVVVLPGVPQPSTRHDWRPKTAP
eukprot:scaffold1280_cov246-Pinguiococcus_pyrenoidosus.AAC.5